jgi:hypothetical protein
MRKILLLLFTFQFSLLTIVAQTAVSTYLPGVTPEGAIYLLPKTGIRISVLVEKTTYTPGELYKYAERYLRIKDVSPTPSVSYRITSIRQEAYPVADTTKHYAIKFDAKTVATNVRLSDDGILLGINTVENGERREVRNQPQNYSFSTLHAPRSTKINPRQYMNEEMLAAGSTAKMAELIAQDIYEIRESRNLLVRGQADNMPKDGEQLRLMLNQLDKQDQAMTSLFTGITEKDTTEHVITIIPDKTSDQQVLFRFSQRLGLLETDDLAGVPYYYKVEDLKTVPPAEAIDPKKKNKQAQGIYVNAPGKLRSTISDAKGIINTAEFPAGQFGNVELLSGVLFNKRYTTRLWLNPLSGAVEKIDVEQPK